MSSKNPWNKIKQEEKKAIGSSAVSFAYIQAEQALEAEEQELLSRALEASLLENTATLTIIDDDNDYENDDILYVNSNDNRKEEDQEDERIPGTATSVDGCGLPMAAAYQIESETSEDERENRKKGILYADVLALAPMTKDEVEEETMRLIKEYQAEEEMLRRKMQEEEDASMALILQMQLQDAEQDRIRLSAQHSHQITKNGIGGHKKIQFVKSFGEIEASPKYEGERKGDDDKCYTDDEYDEVGYRMNRSSNTSGKGDWNRSYASNSMIVGPNGEMRTKHDVELKNKSNAQRLGLSYADTDGVNDKAYNSFKNKMKKRVIGKGGVILNRSEKGEGDASGIGEKTMEGALDRATLLCIQRAINCGVLESMHGAVKEGKEAIVYHADSVQNKPSCSDNIDSKTTVQGQHTFYQEGVAVKVFKRIEDFRNRGEYVDGDPRYYGQGKFKSLDKRAQLELWTEKEFRNLTRAHVAGVPTPVPIAYRENVLFMSFLGDDGWPAPQLKEVDSSFSIRPGSTRWVHLYCEVMVAVRRLYHCARLVHGDLSEYNILLCSSSSLITRSEDKVENENSLTVALIDFGQAVELKHPESTSLLRRDLDRVVKFFHQRCGIEVLPLDDALEFVMEALNFRDNPSQANDDSTNEMEIYDNDNSEKVADVSPKRSSLRKASMRMFNFDSEYSKIKGLLEQKKASAAS